LRTGFAACTISRRKKLIIDSKRLFRRFDDEKITKLDQHRE